MELGLIGEFRLKLYPKDFDACYDFYHETLGFSIVHEWNDGPEDRGVMFNVGGTIVELLIPDDYVRIQGANISLRVTNVWELWEAVKDKMAIVHALRINDWGDTSFAITDPEGFTITFFTKTTEKEKTLG